MTQPAPPSSPSTPPPGTTRSGNHSAQKLRDTQFLRRTPGHSLFLNPSGMAGPPADLLVTVSRILADMHRVVPVAALLRRGDFSEQPSLAGVPSKGYRQNGGRHSPCSRPIATRSQGNLSFRSCPGVNCEIHFIMHEIRYRKAALKALTRLPTDARHRILEALRKLAESADTAALDIKALQGRDGFRLRVGKWRIIYHKDDNALIILVVDAGSRGDIYK
jgi:mRNA interferase RelE/StbE